MKTLRDSAIERETIDRLHRLEPDRRALWGKMNAHQTVCHLSDAFELAIGKRAAQEVSTFASRNLVKFVALRVPFEWPKGVPTRPEVDQFAGGTRPVDFSTDRQRLASLVRLFCQTPRSYDFGRHPIFGAMSEFEWMRWGYLHTDHHLRQFGL